MTCRLDKKVCKNVQDCIIQIYLLLSLVYIFVEDRSINILKDGFCTTQVQYPFLFKIPNVFPSVRYVEGGNFLSLYLRQQSNTLVNFPFIFEHLTFTFLSVDLIVMQLKLLPFKKIYFSWLKKNQKANFYVYRYKRSQCKKNY